MFRRCCFVEKLFRATIGAALLCCAFQNSALAQEIEDREYKQKASYLNKIRASHLGEKDPRQVSALRDLAKCTDRLNLYRSSKVLYSECLRLEERAYGKDSFDLTPTLSDLSWVCTNCGDYAEAKHYALRVLSMYEQRDGADSYNCAVLSGQIARLSEKLGDFDEAQTYFERQLRYAKNNAYPYSPLTQDAYNDLADFQERRGDYLACGMTRLQYAENNRIASGGAACAEQLAKASGAFAKHARGLHRIWWRDAVQNRYDFITESLRSLGGSR